MLRIAELAEARRAERRNQLKRDLEMAVRHVAKGREHIAKQTAMVAKLERDGHDSETAKELLALLHKTQHMHEDHREHILRELQAQAA
jgi:hypothetical protein